MKFEILIDSREKVNSHIIKRLDELKIPYQIKKLSYADYSFEWNGVSYENQICIERKANLTEICGNFAKGKSKGTNTRFQREFERALRDKCKMFLMIEDSSWEKIENREYRSRFSPKELKNRILTWCNKFQLTLKFVDKKDSCDFMLDQFREFIKQQNLRGNDNDCKNSLSMRTLQEG